MIHWRTFNIAKSGDKLHEESGCDDDDDEEGHRRGFFALQALLDHRGDTGMYKESHLVSQLSENRIQFCPANKDRTAYQYRCGNCLMNECIASSSSGGNTKPLTAKAMMKHLQSIRATQQQMQLQAQPAHGAQAEGEPAHGAQAQPAQAQGAQAEGEQAHGAQAQLAQSPQVQPAQAQGAQAEGEPAQGDQATKKVIKKVKVKQPIATQAAVAGKAVAGKAVAGKAVAGKAVAGGSKKAGAADGNAAGAGAGAKADAGGKAMPRKRERAADEPEHEHEPANGNSNGNGNGKAKKSKGNDAQRGSGDDNNLQRLALVATEQRDVDLAGGAASRNEELVKALQSQLTAVLRQLSATQTQLSAMQNEQFLGMKSQLSYALQELQRLRDQEPRTQAAARLGVDIQRTAIGATHELREVLRKQSDAVTRVQLDGGDWSELLATVKETVIDLHAVLKRLDHVTKPGAAGSTQQRDDGLTGSTQLDEGSNGSTQRDASGWTIASLTLDLLEPDQARLDDTLAKMLKELKATAVGGLQAKYDECHEVLHNKNYYELRTHLNAAAATANIESKASNSNVMWDHGRLCQRMIDALTKTKGLVSR